MTKMFSQVKQEQTEAWSSVLSEGTQVERGNADFKVIASFRYGFSWITSQMLVIF